MKEQNTLPQPEEAGVRCHSLRDDLSFSKPLTAATFALANVIANVATANAQTTNAPTSSATNATSQLPDVVVKGEQNSYKPDSVSSPKYTEPLLDIPQTITVIPRSVFQEQGATSLRDVLRNTPGISMQAGEGGVPAGDNLTIRGFSARTDLFVDGVRDFGGYSRDPFNLEQVEVAKGPSSAYAGRGSTGGSINLVSKTPQLGASYDGEFGTGTDDFYRGTVDVNQPIPNKLIPGTAIRVNGMWTDSDVAGRDAVYNERWGIAPSLALGLGTPTRVTFSYFHLYQDNLPDYGIPWVPANTNSVLAAYSDEPAPVDYDNFYGLKQRDYEDVTTDIGTAEFDHDFNESLSLRNLFRAGQTTRDSVITAPRFVNANTSTAINRQIQSRDQTDTIIANQIDLTSIFSTGPVQHTLVTGAEIDYETSENYARTGPTAPFADLYNPNPNDPYPGSVTRTGAKTKTTATTLTLYAFDTVEINEKLELNGGLRWDYFDANYKAYGTNGSVLPGNDLSRIDKLLSWRAGVVYKPVPYGSIYAGCGTSYNPSAEGLTLSTNTTAATNFDLDPEETWTYEVGTKWDLLDQRFSVTFALFRIEKTNARTEDPTDPTDVIALDGKQRVQGVEFGIAGNITRNWSVFGGYSYMHSEVLDSDNAAEEDNQLANTPENTFNFWTTYNLPWNIQLGGGGRFVDSRYSSTANTREAPSYWAFDAMAAYQINEHFSLRLNVFNLTDEEYIDAVGGGHFIPGVRRSAVLTASVDF